MMRHDNMVITNNALPPSWEGETTHRMVVRMKIAEFTRNGRMTRVRGGTRCWCFVKSQRPSTFVTLKPMPKNDSKLSLKFVPSKRTLKYGAALMKMFQSYSVVSKSKDD